MSVRGEVEDSDLDRKGEGLMDMGHGVIPDLQEVTEMGMACLSGAIMLTTTE